MQFCAAATVGIFLSHEEQSFSRFQALAYANLQQRPLNMIKVFQHP